MHMQKGRIVVVEDEGIVAMDISKCLTGLGYEIAFVSDSGERVIEELEHTKADLILMDVELKGSLNGLETAHIVREKHNIPVVFLTAFEDDATLAKISDLSPDGFLVKPFEDEQLKEKVESVLKA